MYYAALAPLAGVLVVAFVLEALSARRLASEEAAAERRNRQEESGLLRRVSAEKRAAALVSAKAGPSDSADQKALQKALARNEAIQALMRKNPEVLALRLKDFRRFLWNGSDDAILGKMGLSLEDRVRFRELKFELLAPRVARPFGQQAPSSEAEAMAGFNQLLGPDGWARYQNLQMQANFLQYFQRFSDFDLKEAGAPLTQQQISALEAAGAEPPPGGWDSQTDPQTGKSLTPQEAYAKRAEGILKPEQLAVVKAANSEDGEEEKLEQKIVADARATGAIGPNDSGEIELNGDQFLSSIRFSPTKQESSP
jgi:hypothetical protein